jgi:hypothetical protein
MVPVELDLPSTEESKLYRLLHSASCFPIKPLCSLNFIYLVVRPCAFSLIVVLFSGEPHQFNIISTMVVQMQLIRALIQPRLWLMADIRASTLTFKVGYPLHFRHFQMTSALI